MGLLAEKKGGVWVVQDAQKSSGTVTYAVQHYPVDKILKMVNDKLPASKHCTALVHSGEIVCPKDARTVDLLAALDRPVKQVDIQAWVWLADKNDMKKHHIWGSDKSVTASPQIIPMSRWVRWIDKITVLAQKGRVQLLASPQIIVTNQTKATIAAGDEVPYWHEKNKDMVVDFKKALLSLSVKPLTLSDKKGLYDIDLSYDKPSASTGQYRHIIRHHLKTQVEIPYKQAILIGGIDQTFHDSDESCPMFFEKVPYLNTVLCDNDNKSHKKSLYMLMTVSQMSVP